MGHHAREKPRGERFGYVCVAFGVLLAGMGLASIWAFVGPKYQNAPDNVPLAAIQLRAEPAQRVSPRTTNYELRTVNCERFTVS